MSKRKIFEKNVLRKQIDFKIELLTKFLDDSAWLCVEKLKKHSFETTKLKTKYYKYIHNKSNKSLNNRLYRCNKGPCTLP